MKAILTENDFEDWMEWDYDPVCLGFHIDPPSKYQQDPTLYAAWGWHEGLESYKLVPWYRILMAIQVHDEPNITPWTFSEEILKNVLRGRPCAVRNRGHAYVFRDQVFRRGFYGHIIPDQGIKAVMSEVEGGGILFVTDEKALHLEKLEDLLPELRSLFP